MGKTHVIRNEQIVYGHHLIKSSVIFTYRQMSRWIFPTVIVFAFSVAFQVVGYFHQDKHDDQYNGAYYLILPAFVIIFLIVVASTVTGKVNRIRYKVGTVLSRDYSLADDLTHVLAYLDNVDDAFKIFGIPISSTLAHIVVFFVLSSLGVFIWEGIH